LARKLSSAKFFGLQSMKWRRLHKPMPKRFHCQDRTKQSISISISISSNRCILRKEVRSLHYRDRIEKKIRNVKIFIFEILRFGLRRKTVYKPFTLMF
jgi:hypothetical protein